ncbi:MAG: potassium channel family protein [Candidatus Binatia bacterium]
MFRIQPVFAIVHRYRFAMLFGSLLVAIGARPLLKALSYDWNPMRLFMALVLLAAIGSAIRERDWSLPILGVAYLMFRLHEALVAHPPLLPLSDAAWVIACTVVAANAIRYVMRTGPVDRERIFAAVDVYLLSAVIFGVVYWLLNQVWPGSFGKSSVDVFTRGDALYFSFVTIATLGYGDIVPTSDQARGLVMIEAVGAQLYLTVLVARLVTLYEHEPR